MHNYDGGTIGFQAALRVARHGNYTGSGPLPPSPQWLKEDEELKQARGWEAIAARV
jgi:hypothetical protein